jgi:hypothetical protein
VLADQKSMVPLVIPRVRDKATELEVNEVMVGDCHTAPLYRLLQSAVGQPRCGGARRDCFALRWMTACRLLAPSCRTLAVL